MRLCSFRLPGEGDSEFRAGKVVEGTVLEVRPRTTLDALVRAGGGPRGTESAGKGFELRGVELGPPIRRPGKIVAAIVNTRGMLGGEDVKLERPRLDMKAPSTVIGPGETIRAPEGGIRPEVELAAVLGRRISRGTPEEARGAIFGYTVLNDVTAPADSRADAYEAYRRDRGTGEIRRATLRGPLFRSKNHDTFCPMGPWIATADEDRHWTKLRMTTRFDGELVQDGSTAEYIFDPPGIASYVSGFLALEPGDVVSCGSVGWTPSALGSLDPTEFVLPSREGVLELEIEGVGKLSNPVKAGR